MIAIEVLHASKVYRRYARRRQFATLKSALLSRSLIRDLTPDETFPALRDVSFTVPHGRTLGVIGRNGSGKSTLLKLVAGITKPTAGTVQVNGRISALIELGAGFHPEISGRENVFINGIMLGLSKREVARRFDQIVEFAELKEFIDAPVKTYSSGMYMRLGFAVAAHIEADILLLDEVFAVGDEAFQRKCIDHVLRFREQGGTVCFVSHDAGAVERLCERAVLLTHGRVEYEGETDEAVKRYHALLAAEESPEELGAGLREWGSGEVRVTDVRLETAAPLSSGDPLVVRLQLRAEKPVAAPRLSLELRESGGGLIGSSALDLDDVGWDGATGERALRFTVDRLPLAEGRFQLGVTLTDRGGGTRYHRIDRAAEFEVASSDARGLLRLEGEWTADGVEVGAG
jgi:ABC-type polysaccharide/polyol phosphate transport system ATPase subunit